MKQNGGIVSRFYGLVIIDYRSALRCGERAIASVTLIQFHGDRGFGDCPMFIRYDFQTKSGQKISGEFLATESSFHAIDTGDQIVVRYVAKNPLINAPEDALCIIGPAKIE